VSGDGMDFVPTLLGGVLLWDFSTRIMQGVSTAFLEDVWSRNFLNLFSSPLSIAEYLSGLVITSMLTSFIGVIVMVALATGVFHLQFFSMGPPLGAFLLVLFAFGISLGIFASAIVLRLGPASEWLLWPLPALLSPFAAVFYPLGRAAAVDAVGVLCTAALLRIRRHARVAGRQALPGDLLLQGIAGRLGRIAAGGVFLHPRVQARRAHRIAGALQRGERGLIDGKWMRPGRRR
jgi:ABC-2 type transport system permease protein